MYVIYEQVKETLDFFFKFKYHWTLKTTYSKEEGMLTQWTHVFSSFLQGLVVNLLVS